MNPESPGCWSRITKQQFLPRWSGEGSLDTCLTFTNTVPLRDEILIRTQLARVELLQLVCCSERRTKAIHSFFIAEISEPFNWLEKAFNMFHLRCLLS